MKLRLDSLEMDFRRSHEKIEFADFTYFYGQMGAGKSSVGRLVDYCFGGDFEATPAIQSEFVSCTLRLTIEDKSVSLTRSFGSNKVRVQYSMPDEQHFDLLAPIKSPEGTPIVPDTDIEVFSDLIFYLANLQPPKVRKSKASDDSDLIRLSFRDLWWYCYLDQDDIDSSFFHLERNGNSFKRSKSKDVLRSVLGLHQEKVATLEAQLESIRSQRMAAQEGAKALKDALEEASVGSSDDINKTLGTARSRVAEIDEKLSILRQTIVSNRTHAVDTLRTQGRQIANEISALETAINDLEEVINDERRHLYEIQTLSVKAHRDAAARAVLGGVEFSACPRCAQTLPERDPGTCNVCGQTEPLAPAKNIDPDLISEDVKSREKELKYVLDQHKEQHKLLKVRKEEFVEQKGAIDVQLNKAMSSYDSAYLSSALELEKERSQELQSIASMQKLIKLPQAVDNQFRRADEYLKLEEGIKRELHDARTEAEKDTGNLRKLENLFLDCLLRAKVPGFTFSDEVNIKAPWFLPEVSQSGAGDMIINSFANLGSGGKKTLFKACFALAVHRLSKQVDGFLPTLVIIDSPMKNISERANRVQFEGFHDLLYDLSQNELDGTQFILIDKEYLPTPEKYTRSNYARHMVPNDSDERNDSNPPLIPYWPEVGRTDNHI